MATTPARRPTMQWSEAPGPLLGLLTAAVVLSAAVAVDTALASSTAGPGAVLGWLPLVAAAAAVLVALRWNGTAREAALTAAVAFLALFPLLDPAPQPWMYAAPLAAVALALGVRLLPTTQAVA